MHFAAIAVPGPRSPGFRTNIDISIPIHVANLQLVPAQFGVEDNLFHEAPSAEVAPQYPTRILSSGWEQFLLLVRDDVQLAVVVKIGYRQGMQRAVLKTLRQFLL